MNSKNHTIDNFIALDTAGDTIVVAVSLAGKVHSKSANRAESRTRNCAVLTEELMRELELTFADIEGVIVALGPGSFTGLRVGLSFAKGIVGACDIPLVGVSRFEQALHQLREAKEPIPEALLVLMKANTYYRFRVSSAEEAQVDVVTIEDLAESQESMGFIDCDIPVLEGKTINATKAQSINFRLESLFQAAAEKYQSGALTPWTELEPLYIQRSGAEIRALEARKS